MAGAPDNPPPSEDGPPPRGDRSALWIIGIVTSVCGAILSPYLLAITEFLSRITINAIGFFYHGYVDSIYAHAVINPSDFPIFIIFSLIYVLPIIGMLSMMLLRPIVVRIAQRRPPPKERNMYIIFTLILLVLTAITFEFVSGPFVSMQVNESFQKRVMALSAVMSEHEKNVILAQWALMTSRADYDHINQQLETLSKKYNEPLPLSHF